MTALTVEISKWDDKAEHCRRCMHRGPVVRWRTLQCFLFPVGGAASPVTLSSMSHGGGLLTGGWEWGVGGAGWMFWGVCAGVHVPRGCSIGSRCSPDLSPRSAQTSSGQCRVSWSVFVINGTFSVMSTQHLHTLNPPGMLWRSHKMQFSLWDEVTVQPLLCSACFAIHTLWDLMDHSKMYLLWCHKGPWHSYASTDTPCGHFATLLFSCLSTHQPGEPLSFESSFTQSCIPVVWDNKINILSSEQYETFKHQNTRWQGKHLVRFQRPKNKKKKHKVLYQRIHLQAKIFEDYCSLHFGCAHCGVLAA